MFKDNFLHVKTQSGFNGYILKDDIKVIKLILEYPPNRPYPNEYNKTEFPHIEIVAIPYDERSISNKSYKRHTLTVEHSILLNQELNLGFNILKTLVLE